MTRFILIEDEEGSAVAFTLLFQHMTAKAKWDVSVDWVRGIDHGMVSRHDCILLDLKLADGDIHETIRRIPELAGTGIPVIVLTNSMNMDIGDACIAAGAEDYIRKEDLNRSPEATVQRLYYAIQRRKRKGY